MRPSPTRSGSWAILSGAFLACVAVLFGEAPRAEDARDRPYPHGDWQEDCSLCHPDDTWIPVVTSKGFDHSAHFVLEGAHRAVPCRSCHPSLDFSRARKACVTCHQDVHRGEFGTDCSRCHTARSFIDRSEAVRSHRASRFPLSGAHAAADCESCHTMRSLGRTMYVGLPVECAGCHDSRSFPAAPQPPPDHPAAEPTGDCSLCHNTVTFGDARSGHPANGFPLTASHAIPCVNCHGQPFNPNLDPACVSCHLSNYDATTDPNHRLAGFPTDCALCHNTTTFTGATFNHAGTLFPLTGAHVAQDCVACHADGVYDGKSTACYSCHQANYDATIDPNHRLAGFPTDCALCHNTTTFTGATFDHAGTSFPLTGAHVALNCSACHADGVYAGKSTACYSCHQSSYNATTDPNHRLAGFPTDCALCHNTTTFAGATFDHAGTSFPLTGAHVALNCSACHADGVYDGKSTACYSCHQANYDATTDPNHQAAGFSHDCTLCHNTTTFAGARYAQHDSAYFPIYSGSHSNLWTLCSDCHTNSLNYATFSCFLCHSRPETNPIHSGVSGYVYNSNACYTCHPRGSAE